MSEDKRPINHLWLNIKHDPDANSTWCAAQITATSVVHQLFVEDLLWENRAEYLWDVGHALSVATFVRQALAQYTRRTFTDGPF